MHQHQQSLSVAPASEPPVTITQHLVACADLLRDAADAKGLSRKDFNAMQAAKTAGELAYQSAELRAQGFHEEADRYTQWALLKLSELLGRSIPRETSAS
ncbi:MAG: hypothetical protein Q4G14_05920 [Paracoccus sp. (in: a-proteobacteria)]|uniref:hypothetical protein n=1 Tax=Paracoccus sp. TaxID=267 RepID=UPI0026DEDE93|nr:hypothetical protein [Paracoccus sp. (in: a-proteobacteria)]MDO5612766.1 hypothetical protein [Paracoccus sp. (in: a-proteobacteria)]